ncbi:MAG: hypothetical protein FJX77_11335, partial [Armatimonadetes bacterium]|nr:hypothetical protein [Armatimonadota bacterium]
MSAVNRVPLESSGRHSVLCRREPSGEWLLELCHSDADRRSAAHRGLFQHLRVHAGEREWAFEPRTDRVVLPPDVGRLQIRLGGAGAVPVADLEVRGDGLHELARHPLSPLELRYLAEVGFPHPQPADPPPGTAGTGTDLHTHFAGCVRPEDLLRLGLDAGVDYCLAALREAGIQWEGAGTVPLAQLSPEVTTRLLTRWAVPPDRQIPFRGLERIYQLRRPLTKHPRLFLPLLRQIAADY